MSKNRKLLTHNAETVLKLLLMRLEIPYSSAWEREHEEHPDYPSFLSFHQLLKKHGVESAVLQPDFDLLKRLPAPFAIHIRPQPNEGMFLLADHIDDEHLYFINEKNEIETNPTEYIKQVWSGYVLIVNREKINVERPSLSEKTVRWLTDYKSVLTIAVFSAIIIGLLVTMSGEVPVFRYLFCGCFLAGLAVSVLLLVRLFDKHNPFVQKLCHSAKSAKADCSSVLDSDAAYFLGIFSWSEIGFVYFFYLFWAVLIGGETGLALAVGCSLLAFPYVFYSIGYQWFVSRKWCRLCLATQAVLLLSFVTALFAWKTVAPEIWSVRALVWFCLTGLAAALVYALIKPMIAAYLENRMLVRRYRWLKHAPVVKESLFSVQPELNPSELKRIVLYPQGKQSVTAIVNTTCQPCMQEIKRLTEMFRNKTETRLEIIFFLREQDERAMNAAVYLWERYENDPEHFIDVLADYATHYPAVSVWNERKEGIRDSAIREMIRQQQTWCYERRIASTPMLLFNYKKPPYFYEISDLDYMCN